MVRIKNKNIIRDCVQGYKNIIMSLLRKHLVHCGWGKSEFVPFETNISKKVIKPKRIFFMKTPLIK